jgi:hypothetical protein
MGEAKRGSSFSWVTGALVVFCALLAIGALAFSGSFFQGILGIIGDGGYRGEEESAWGLFANAFVRDLTGEPGLFVAGIKLLFAVVVAFGVMQWASTARGNLSFKIGPLELSAIQSKAIIWCLVFVLIKWL